MSRSPTNLESVRPSSNLEKKKKERNIGTSENIIRNVSFLPNLPQIQPTSWHTWEIPSNFPRMRDEDTHLENRLKWPHGALSILEEAFRLSLSRFTGWDTSKIPTQHQKAFELAASIYKRGVKLKSSSASFLASVPSNYEIHIFPHLDEVGKIFNAFKTEFAVIDQNVLLAWPFLEDLPNYEFYSPSENNKNLDTVAAILEKWEKVGSPKNWVLIGGGVACDTGSFAAHLVGASFTYIPTSLLAMVDACVGGKTGINFLPYGKNMLGAFAFPKHVYIWSGWLETLNEREIYSGGSECIKHAIISGSKECLEETLSALKSKNPQKIGTLLPQLIQVKINCIVSDPYELSGTRQILNFGHTLGHAIETISNIEQPSDETILHGEAVAIGMLFAVRLSYEEGHLKDRDFKLIKKALKDSNCLISARQLQKYLGTKITDPNLLPKILSYAKNDKKQIGTANFQWILLKGLGQFVNDETKNQYAITITEKQITKSWTAMLTSDL